MRLHINIQFCHRSALILGVFVKHANYYFILFIPLFRCVTFLILFWFLAIKGLCIFCLFSYTCCVLVTDRQSLGCLVTICSNSGTTYCHPSCLVTVSHVGLFKCQYCNLFPGDHDSSYIIIAYLFNVSVAIYMFPNILVSAHF